MPAFSLILPAHDEAACLGPVLREAHGQLAAVFADFEILVVDDGSGDGGDAVVRGLQAELPGLRLLQHPRRRGYGRALRTGFAAARGELVMYTDADGQFDLGELRAALPLLAAHPVLLGYRVRAQYRPLRRFLSWGFNRLVRVVFGVRVRDVDCSFKIFTRAVLQQLELRSEDFFIDTEIVAELGRLGLRPVQLGVTHRPRLAGRTSVRPSHIPKTCWTVLRMWWLRRRPAAPRVVLDPTP